MSLLTETDIEALNAAINFWDDEYDLPAIERIIREKVATELEARAGFLDRPPPAHLKGVEVQDWIAVTLRARAAELRSEKP